MSVLGKHVILPRKQNLSFNHDSPGSRLQNITLEYPLQGSPNTPVQIQIRDLWTKLTDDSFSGNIINRISTTKSGLLTCPLIPQMLPHTVGNEEVATERAQLNNHYKTWLDNHRPHLTENKLFRALLVTLRKEVGTMYQGYNTNSYLQCITQELSTYGSIDNAGLCNDWKAVAKCKSIDEQAIFNSPNCKDVVKNLLSFVQKSKGNLTSFEKLAKKIKSLLYFEKTVSLVLSFVREKHQKTSLSESYILKNMVEDQIKTAYLLSHMMNEGKEKDIIIILPHRRCILHIEVKDVESPNKFNENKKKANEQLQDLKTWMETCHSDIFQGWDHVGVMAFPSLERDGVINKFDPSEQQHLIFMEDLEDQMVNWWKGISQTIPKTPQETSMTEPPYVEYVKRTIALSKFGSNMRFGEKEWCKHTRNQLVGQNVDDVRPGGSNADKWPTANGNVTTNLNKVSAEERNVLSVILWSDEQQGLLDNDPVKIITWSDFGTGKTLVLKSKALEEASTTAKQVFYISLASVSFGSRKPSFCPWNLSTVDPKRREVTEVPAVFDVATRAQFLKTKVTFVDALEMKDLYEKEQQQQHHQQQQQQEPSELLLWFLRKHPNASFFIDEWGWSTEGLNTLNSIMGLSKDQRIWTSIRLIGYRTIENNKEMKSMLQRIHSNFGVVLCDMPIIMRATATVTNASKTVTGSMGSFANYFATEDSLGKPLDTVPGLRPWYGNVTSNSTQLKRIIKKIQDHACGDSMVMIVPHGFQYLCTLEKSLKEMLKSYVVYLSTDKESDIDELQRFLDGQVDILITNIGTFTGMEADIVVSFETYDPTEQYHTPRDVFLRSSLQLFVVCVENPIVYNWYKAVPEFNDLGSFRSPIGHLIDNYYYFHVQLPSAYGARFYSLVNNRLNKWIGSEENRWWLCQSIQVLFTLLLIIVMMFGVYFVTLTTFMSSSMTAIGVALIYLFLLLAVLIRLFALGWMKN